MTEFEAEQKARRFVQDAGISAVPVDLGLYVCVFRSMPGHDSGACRAGIPLDAGPRFRSMPAGVSEAG